jgi:hypothetical protein
LYLQPQVHAAGQWARYSPDVVELPRPWTKEESVVSQYEMLTLVLQAVVAVAAFATLAFLYRQIRIMMSQITASQEAARASAALAIVAHLQSQDVRAAREVVRSKLRKKGLSEWTPEERRSASTVCANYDVAAALLRADLAPVDLFAHNWGPSVRDCYEILSPFVQEHRTGAGADPSYWSNFDWLNDQVGRRLSAENRTSG